jgi:predicted DCC family thiol-disulfide oxidoreductase YuxK
MNNISDIVLFDGHCNLCNGTVKFIIKRDPNAKFHFAALQSPVGERLLSEFNLPTDAFETFVLIQEDRYYIKSSAALHVVKKLKGIWKLLYVFVLVPRPIRDYLYSFIAKRRYRWFGRRDACMIPTADIRQRFLAEIE